MNTANNLESEITPAADSVKAVFDVWKKLEEIRTDVVINNEPISAEQWRALQTDIYVARDAYFLAIGQFIDSQDPAVARLVSEIEQVSRQLDEMKQIRAKIEKTLGLVDKLAGLVGKLLALAAA